MTTSVSMDSSSLAGMATSLKSGNVQNQISMAVMKQMQDQQQVMNNALLEMIKQGPMPDGTGSVLNIGA